LPGGLSVLATGESILPPSPPIMDEELSIDQLMAYMNKKPTLAMAGSLKVERADDGEIITINEKALLTEDRSGINPAIAPFLNKLGDLVNEKDYPVEIIGHTDVGAAQDKGYKSNWELSTLMAVRVLKYLVSKSKIAPERLTAYGYGDSRPIASNDTVHSRAQNRRVEIVLKYSAPDYVKRIFKKRSPGFFTYKKFDFKIF
jgi:flagellar motor protein MotB